MNDDMNAEAKMEILEAISLLAQNVQDISDRMDDMSGKMDDMSGKMVTKEYLKEYVSEELNRFEARLATRMVTKDYLDRKLFELRGDLILISKKSNTKFSTLVERLVERKSISRKVANDILALEPFAKA